MTPRSLVAPLALSGVLSMKLLLDKAFCLFLLIAITGCAAMGGRAVADSGWEKAGRMVIDPESGRPYRLEQVFVPSGKDRIASTLLTPDSGGRAPLVITVSGAGTGLAVPEAPLYRRLVGRGYAVLALGKKGVGASSGDWRKESFEDRAANVVAAMDWASARTDIDGDRIVLYGHSQGGYVIPLVQADPRVVALVLAAGPSRAVRDQIVDDEFTTAKLMGMDEETARKKALRTRRLLDIGLRACPLVSFHYLCNVYRFDPTGPLAAIDKPVLALFNELDPMVPPATNLAPMQALLAANPRAEIRVLPKADHDHLQNPTGLQSEAHRLIGPEARFPHAREGDPDHARLAKSWVNRVPYAEGYLDAVESFVLRHMSSTRVAAP